MSIGITAGTAALIAGGLGAAGAVGGSLIGANASQSAASQQVAEQDKALAQQEAQYQQGQANLAPFVSGGGTSFSSLLSGLQNGTFGPGSVGPAPTFTAPTGVTAQNDPGYQFQLNQGDLGVERGAAAAGGAFTGGTLKSLAGYNQQMGNTAYQSVFNNALNSYGAQLQGYQTNLGAQAQAYNQLLTPAQIGESAAAGAGSLGVQSAAQIGNTLTNTGAAQAAGTIGGASALSGGLQSATGAISNGLTLPLYLQYAQSVQPQQPIYPNNYGTGTPTLMQNGAPYQPSTAGTIDFSQGGAPN